MTDVTTQPARTAYDGWGERRWRLLSLAVAVLWLAAAATMLLTGERRTDLDALEAGVRDGSVARVEVIGWPGGLDDGSAYRLRWHDVPVDRYTVVHVDVVKGGNTPTRDQQVIDQNPTDFLVGLDPDIEVVSVEPSAGTYTEWRGWRGPGWTGLVGFAAWFATLVLLRHGPEPRRATRWAWGWLVLLGGPLGALAYLILGGPLGVRGPTQVRGRLTGGWAFLLTLILFGNNLE